MIHSPRVIDRITELIKLAGISSDVIIEEMTDHYLSDIEHKVQIGISEQKAIRETYQAIASINLKSLEQKKSSKRKWAIGLILFFLLLQYGMTHYENDSKNNDIANATVASINIPNGWPIDNVTDQITSGFGLRNHPLSNTKRFHKGIDIKADIGTPVLVTGDGFISESGYNRSLGRYIIVHHNQYYSTRYLHLSKLEIVEGQSVKKGDVIGKVGNSGLSMAPHLHYEVIKNESVIDPLDVIAP